MPSYRIHRLKDHLQQQFRYAPHTSGKAVVKPRDYEPGDVVDAASPYAAFFALKDSDRPLQLGDLLEYPEATLKIFKFVGFEEAEWLIPEVKPADQAASETPVSGQ